MSAAVIGLGKLGMPLALKLASKGNEVWIYDTNKNLMESIFKGTYSSNEPTVNDLYQSNFQYLRKPESISDIVKKCEVVFIVVPTPSQPDGKFSNRAIVSVIEELIPGLKSRKTNSSFTINIVSTVMPGSCDQIFVPLIERALERKLDDSIGLCYNPEFIALGSVVRDMEYPDMHLVGASSKYHGEIVLKHLARIACIGVPSAFLSLTEAELVKISINNYITLKISFANMIQVLSDKFKLPNANLVTDAIGMDKRIGKNYLKAGSPFAGPCFPRDTIAMQSMLEDDVNLARAVTSFNASYLSYVVSKVLEHAKPYKSIGIVGLTYKEGSDVFEGSIGVELARVLVKNYKEVIVFDADFSGQLLPVESIVVADSLEELLSNSEFIVFTKFTTEQSERQKVVSFGKPCFDVWNQ